MKDGATHAIVQAYNAQAAVDAHAQIIVAATITTDAADTEQLVPLVAAVEANLGRRPAVVVADKGYWNTKHVQAVQTTPEARTPIEVLVPPERDPDAGPTRSSPLNAVAEAMRERLTSEPGRTLYGRRQGTVEPVFGVLKEQQGARQFSFRGEQKNEAEWQIFCLTHNIRKLHRHRYPVRPPGKRKKKLNSASRPVSAAESHLCGPNSRHRPWWATRRWEFGRPTAA